jgi:hypothetical protein
VELKVTVAVEVCVPGYAGVTIAVKVTDWFTEDGDCEELTAVVVPAGFTVWTTLFDVAALKLLLELVKEPLIVCGPAVANEATQL